jgi:hypothetical protein
MANAIKEKLITGDYIDSEGDVRTPDDFGFQAVGPNRYGSSDELLPSDVTTHIDGEREDYLNYEATRDTIRVLSHDIGIHGLVLCEMADIEVSPRDRAIALEDALWHTLRTNRNVHFVKTSRAHHPAAVARSVVEHALKANEALARAQGLDRLAAEGLMDPIDVRYRQVQARRAMFDQYAGAHNRRERAEFRRRLRRQQQTNQDEITPR